MSCQCGDPAASSPVRSRQRIVRGDTWWSPWWAVLIDGDGVDLTDGWTVAAQMRLDGEVVIGFDSTSGAEVLLSTASVDAGSSPPTVTSTVRLYMTPGVTETLVAGPRPMVFDVEISHPTFGPLGDPYKVTIVRGTASVTRDVTR